MEIKRRQFIKRGLMVTLSVLLFKPLAALAAWPKRVFRQKHFTDALHVLLADKQLIESDQITLKIPAISQNGVEVPVTIESTLPSIDSIVIMVENNPNPMSAEFLLQGGAAAYIATRIKMNGTSLVHAIVKSNDKFYSTSEMVTVKRGGCFMD